MNKAGIYNDRHGNIKKRSIANTKFQLMKNENLILSKMQYNFNMNPFGRLSLIKTLIFILLLSSYIGNGQVIKNLQITNNTYLSNSDDLPFWFVSNQNGKLNTGSSPLNLSELKVMLSDSLSANSNFSYSMGTNVIAGIADNNYLRANELYASVYCKIFKLKTGLFQNEVKYFGLSSTNGDFHWSNNTRPIPRIQLATNDFIRFKFFPSWLKIKGKYEEGILNDDNRYVKNTRLHHKLVHINFQLNEKSFLVVGLDHYAMWGGVSPNLGNLPSGFSDYIRTVFGLPGDEDYIHGDQSLMAGNQLGKYIIRYNKVQNWGEFELYLNHPFTDRMDYSNYKDNLVGVFFSVKNNKFLKAFMYEFMYTKDQRLPWNKKGTYDLSQVHGVESYFMHGTYKSGMSYNNRMIGSPFAIPIIMVDGTNYGTGNNMIILHHVGISGQITNQLFWRTKISYSKNFGTYNDSYDNKVESGFFDTPREQINSYGELSYFSKNKHWNVITAIAIDKGNLLKHNVGVQLSLSYNIF